MTKKILLLLSFGLTLYFTIGRPSWWFAGQADFIARAEPRTGDDDSVYYYTAEHFWGLEHDPGFVKLHPGFAAVIKAYPLRGIGLGSLVLAFQRTYGNGRWRVPYTRFVFVLNIVGAMVFAYALASFLKHPFLLAPLFAFFIHKYHLQIIYPALWCTEAVTRALVPLFLGSVFFLLNQRFSPRIEKILHGLIVLLGLLLCLFKIQWILGMILMAGVLFLSRPTRRVAFSITLSIVLSILAVRSINYFRFGKNTELFSGSGQYALGWSPEGPTILRLACERDKVPLSLRETICAQTIETFWSAFDPSMAPAEDKAALFREFSRINSELTRKNIPARLMRLASNSKKIIRELAYIPELPTRSRTVKLVVGWSLCLLLLPFLQRDQALQILAVCAFVFGALFVPTISVLVFGEFRYYIPVRNLFYLMPVLGILAGMRALAIRWLKGAEAV